MTSGEDFSGTTESGRAVAQAWPDLFANLQAAYAKVIDTQFEMERRAAELKDSRDLLRQVIASMSEALFLLDRTGRVMQVNPAALALIDSSEADCLGQLFRKICPDPNAPISAWKILNRAAHGSLTGLETQLRGSDGQFHPVNLSASVVRNHGGRIDGVLIIAQDLQPQQHVRTEQAHNIREAVTTQLAAGMASKLADPVEVIRGYSQHLQDIGRLGDVIDEQWLTDLQRIEVAAKQLTKLVNHLHSLGRPTLGIFKPVNINQVVESALLIASVRQNYQEVIPLEVTLEPSLPAVQGDWHELTYAVTDLVEQLYESRHHQLVSIHCHSWCDDKQIGVRIVGNLSSATVEQPFPIRSFIQNVVGRHGGAFYVEASKHQLILSLTLPGLVE